MVVPVGRWFHSRHTRLNCTRWLSPSNNQRWQHRILRDKKQIRAATCANSSGVCALSLPMNALYSPFRCNRNFVSVLLADPVSISCFRCFFHCGWCCCSVCMSTSIGSLRIGKYGSMLNFFWTCSHLSPIFSAAPSCLVTVLVPSLLHLLQLRCLSFALRTACSASTFFNVSLCDVGSTTPWIQP